MKNGSTLFLKIVISLIGLAVLALCIFILPQGIMTDNTGLYRPILIGMYVPAIPFYIALFQGWKLLNLIDQNQAFSMASVQALNKIKICAGFISAVYALGLPFIFMAAEQDDAPGVILIGLIFFGGPLVVSIAAGIMQTMFSNAIAMKSENELTV